MRQTYQRGEDLTFLSTLSLRRATRARRPGQTAKAFLSTLSLRRATYVLIRYLISARYFYPRSPCGERRCGCFARCRYWAYFYPRSPCGERHIICQRIGIRINISIHALLAESDLLSSVSDSLPALFLSTLSLRRATLESYLLQASQLISIHALLAESDPRENLVNGIGLIFLSTLSLRRATY